MDTESEGVRKTSGGQMAYQEVLKFSREEVRAVINNSDTWMFRAVYQENCKS